MAWWVKALPPSPEGLSLHPGSMQRLKERTDCTVALRPPHVYIMPFAQTITRNAEV